MAFVRVTDDLRVREEKTSMNIRKFAPRYSPDSNLGVGLNALANFKLLYPMDIQLDLMWLK